jgi:hypothetical protein
MRAQKSASAPTPGRTWRGLLEACGRPGGHLAAAVYAFGKGLELNGERPQTVVVSLTVDGCSVSERSVTPDRDQAGADEIA